jgi:hypothetical protein
MSSQATYAGQDLCPCCGEFAELDEQTGWCLPCSGELAVGCMNCGKFFEKDLPHRKLCPSCRNERWLERNADLMDDLIARHGLTPRRAQLEIYRFNRPLCLSCNQPIRGGRAGDTFFCTTSVACKKWQRRYRTLREAYQRKHVLDVKKQALAAVSAEIYIFHHKENHGDSREGSAASHSDR